MHGVRAMQTGVIMGRQLGMGLGQLQKVEMRERNIHFTTAFSALITGEMQAGLKKEHCCLR